jgi:hypothetical protein
MREICVCETCDEQQQYTHNNNNNNNNYNNNNIHNNRYEDLQSKTVEVLLSLFKFFGIDYNDKVIAGLNPATTKKFTSDNLKV